MKTINSIAFETIQEQIKRFTELKNELENSSDIATKISIFNSLEKERLWDVPQALNYFFTENIKDIQCNNFMAAKRYIIFKFIFKDNSSLDIRALKLDESLCTLALTSVSEKSKNTELSLSEIVKKEYNSQQGLSTNLL